MSLKRTPFCGKSGTSRTQSSRRNDSDVDDIDSFSSASNWAEKHEPFRRTRCIGPPTTHVMVVRVFGQATLLDGTLHHLVRNAVYRSLPTHARGYAGSFIRHHVSMHILVTAWRHTHIDTI